MIGYLPIGAAEIESGRLAPVHPLEVPSRDGYWLVTRKGQPPRKAAALFIDWLIAQRDEPEISRRERVLRTIPDE